MERMKRQFVLVALLVTILTGAFAQERKVVIVKTIPGESDVPLYCAQVDFTDIGLDIVKYKFYKDEDWDPEANLKFFEEKRGLVFVLNTNLDPSIQKFMKENGVSFMMLCEVYSPMTMDVYAANYYNRKTGKFYWGVKR
jgi:hypothetical protein